MESKKGCVYCGLEGPLSESDIVPDALTNAKLRYQYVCQIEHNNRFSDLFESEIINRLSVITNALDIKSSKGTKYPTFDVTLRYEGQEYKARISSDTDFGKKKGYILSTADKKAFIGDPNQLTKISKDPSLVKPVQREDIEYSTKIDLRVFFEPPMHRLVSKIAFEWLCSKTEIDNYCPEFKNIVDFITQGVGRDPVKMVTTPVVYELMHEYTSMGSHCLLLYRDTDNHIVCIISLFGLATYYVQLDIDELPFKGISFIELRTDSQRKEVDFATIDEARQVCNSIFVDAGPGIKTLKDPSNQLHIMQAKVLMLHNSLLCSNMSDLCNEEDKRIVPVLRGYVNEIMNSSLLHRRGLKRFVDDNIPYRLKDGEHLEIERIDGRKLIFAFTVFCIGRSNMTSFDEGQLKQMISNELPIDANNELHLDEKVEERIKAIILSDDEYCEKILRGAELIRAW